MARWPSAAPRRSPTAPPRRGVGSTPRTRRARASARALAARARKTTGAGLPRGAAGSPWAGDSRSSPRADARRPPGRSGGPNRAQRRALATPRSARLTRALLEPREQLVARGNRELAKTADRARARVGHGGPVIEHRDVRDARCEPRIRRGRSRRERRPGRSARQHVGRARGARAPGARGRSQRSAIASAARRGAAPARAPAREACPGRGAVQASRISTPSPRLAGGASRLRAESQPVAWRQANWYAAPERSASAWSATAGSSSSSIVRSIERSARLSSSSRSASCSSNDANASVSRARDDGPMPRRCASATAEDTLWVSASACLSASISSSPYCRWPPPERCGRGKP